LPPCRESQFAEAYAAQESSFNREVTIEAGGGGQRKYATASIRGRGKSAFAAGKSQKEKFNEALEEADHFSPKQNTAGRLGGQVNRQSPLFYLSL